MKALIYTNEFPPYNYGGAGVHVEYLTRELAKLIDVDVRCFGDQDVTEGSLKARGYGLDESLFKDAPKNLKSILGTFTRNIAMNASDARADVVHCHTWYTHFAGVLTQILYEIPLVITCHSLEPLRPWKVEQLGSGYALSSWVEKTAIERADAVIAVSKGMKEDVVRLFDVDPGKVLIVPNGIDTDEYQPQTSTAALEKYGIDPKKPFVLFVGRIARQKGIIHLVNAIPKIREGVQIVLCAGAPDTPEIAEEMKTQVAAIQKERDGVIWIAEMVDKPTVRELYSHAAVFACPSIYEPFGIINLEAMACETAVVASAVGGITEVVVDGETGFLVPLDQLDEAPFEPRDPKKFSADLAEKINVLIDDPARREAFGKAGRKRAVELYSWSSIAEQVKEIYASLIEDRK
jgi:glycogen synthase